ncbi:MAG: rRNA pseudouridine synthase [Chitinophagaceae bacterium]|nr:rRNA pseudouridine synthase [Chitinophagaceae bacterium]
MIQKGYRYFAVNKPYNMVSQFVSPHKVKLLGHLDYPFPEGIHAIGRLDNHSEGLLLLSTNRNITRLLFQGKQPHKRTYLVKVKNTVTEATAQLLRSGIAMPVKGRADFVTAPCEVEITERPPGLFSTPYELEEYGTHSWLSITLTEGKFHQVRKMVAAVHHRCKRLIRTSIEDLQLGDLAPGQVQEYQEDDFFRLLKL